MSFQLIDVFLSSRLPENVVRTGNGNANSGGGGGMPGAGSELFEKFQRQKLNKENGHPNSSLNDRLVVYK